jgi:hypothetical protein
MTSFWRDRYEIRHDGRVVARWNSSLWRHGGDLSLDGQLYQVRGNTWASRFEMTDALGTPLAHADRVGRTQWTVTSGGQTYHFSRRSFWSGDQLLHTDAGVVGSVRRTSFWSTETAADLPGLPLPVQVFVLAVVITLWNMQTAAATA